MLAELERAFPRRVPAVLGVSKRTVDNWRARRVPVGPAARCVWFAWAFLLHPSKAATFTDVLTWGRFAQDGTPPVVSE